MKRARHQNGSVVFDKRRKTWNFLWRENGQRRSKLIGTKQEYATKASAWKDAEFLRQGFGLSRAYAAGVITVSSLITKYREERMSERFSTRRSNEAWFRNHVLPRWGNCSIEDVQPREVELWLKSLNLSPKSRVHIRGLLHQLWEFGMWRGDVPSQRNPMELVTIKGATKRRKPRSLTEDEFRKFLAHLGEPIRTIALLGVSFGLRISECLALKWLDVDWLKAELHTGNCDAASWRGEDRGIPAQFVNRL